MATKHHEKDELPVEEIISGNPQIDADQFRDAQVLLNALRKEGLARPTYSLGSPYRRGRQPMHRQTRGLPIPTD